MSARPFYIHGWHVICALALFFSTIVAVNVAFAWVAIASFPGEDVPRSYAQGLHFNETLAERRAEAALGWRASAAFVVAPAIDGGAGVLEVRLVDRHGAPLLAELTGDLERPTDARFDRHLNFESNGGGRYVARAKDLAPGVWRLRARAEGAQGGALNFEAELLWQMRP